jgi:hypothetical protein
MMGWILMRDVGADAEARVDSCRHAPGTGCERPEPWPLYSVEGQRSDVLATSRAVCSRWA